MGHRLGTKLASWPATLLCTKQLGIARLCWSFVSRLCTFCLICPAFCSHLPPSHIKSRNVSFSQKNFRKLKVLLLSNHSQLCLSQCRIYVHHLCLSAYIGCLVPSSSISSLRGGPVYWALLYLQDLSQGLAHSMCSNQDSMMNGQTRIYYPSPFLPSLFPAFSLLSYRSLHKHSLLVM